MPLRPLTICLLAALLLQSSCGPHIRRARMGMSYDEMIDRVGDPVLRTVVDSSTTVYYYEASSGDAEVAGNEYYCIQVTNGKFGALHQESQVRWFLGIVILATLLILVWLIIYFDAPWLEALRHALFNTVAIITGTGYASANFGAWGTLPVALLFFLMCVGGCTGSTTGGIKVFRFAVLHVIAKNQFARLVRPHGVFIPSYNGRPLQEAASIAVMAFLFMFGLAFAVIALALSAMGLDYLTAMSGSLTALANVGPGLGPNIGPTGNFASLPDGAKWLLSAAMLLGRLELLTVLILFTPAFWRS